MIFMKITRVHTLRADWLMGVGLTLDTVRIKTSRVSVLGTYMTSRYILDIT